MALRLHLPLLPCSKTKTILRSSISALKTRQRLSTPNALPSSSVRRSANYHPTIWDDNYIQSLPFNFTEEKYVKRSEKLKEEVRRLIGKPRGIIERLEFVDAMRQLGVSYHFDSEIKELLTSVDFSEESLKYLIEKNSLHGVSLMFRLFREHGINASKPSVEDLLNCLKRERRSFDSTHEHFVKGMMSLYEASYLSIEGEDELEHAGEFATKYLKNIDRTLLNEQITKEIDHVLELPLHWRMPRLHARWYIDAYERQKNVNHTLLEFAKLDFNMVQGVYKKELKEMSMWWRNLGLVCEELSFARNRLVEHYLWSIGFVFRPEFWRCRKAITKIISILTIIDDIYDIYGTMDELQLFTNAMQRWNTVECQELPEYMKICLTQVFRTMNDIAQKFLNEKGLDVLPCLKQMLGDLCNAYLVEARWYHTGYTPSLNEYLENAWITISGACELAATYCLSDELTIEALDSLELYPPIVRTSSMLFRLYDDLATATDEIQRGDVPKSIQCYMIENNASEFEARDYIKKMIRKYWKDLNEIHFTSTKCIMSFQEATVDIPRMAQCFYQYGDGLGDPNQETRDRVMLLLVEPISI